MASVSNNVEERRHRAAEYWNLRIRAELTGGTSSAVFAARDELGRDLVLKLPATHAAGRDITGAEAAALIAWADTGAAVTLLDATDDALFLVRARPGSAWPWDSTKSSDDTIAVAAELLNRLWSPPAGSYRFANLNEVYPEREQLARNDAVSEQLLRGEPDRGMPGLVRLPTARGVVEKLSSSTREPKLLHGDFISKNIVADTTSPIGWVSLDPLPMVGDPAADVGAFAAYHPTDLILPIAQRLACEVKLEPHRVLQWAAIWAVHQAAQAWREDQDVLERLIASTTIDKLLKI